MIGRGTKTGCQESRSRVDTISRIGGSTHLHHGLDRVVNKIHIGLIIDDSVWYFGSWGWRRKLDHRQCNRTIAWNESGVLNCSANAFFLESPIRRIDTGTYKQVVWMGVWTKSMTHSMRQIREKSRPVQSFTCQTHRPQKPNRFGYAQLPIRRSPK